MRRCKGIIALILALVFCCAGLNVSAAVAGSNVSNNLAKDFQQLNVDVVANKISISGIAGYAEKAMVSFYMVQGETVVYVKQIYTETDGTFETELVLSPAAYDANGTGTLIVGCSNANSRKIEGIELYSQTELDSCVSDFQNIASKADMESFIDAYKDMLAIKEEYNSDEIGIIYDGFVENAPENLDDCDAVIAVIDELISYVSDYRNFFIAINAAASSGDGAEIKKLLTVTYKDIVPFVTDMTLIQDEAAVYRKMAEAFTEDYTSFEDVEAAFNAAKLAQRDDEAENGYVTTDRTKSFIDEAWKISVNGNYLTISGQTDDEGTHSIVFYVSDYNVTSPVPLALYQMETESDGSFTATFALDANVYGEETMGLVQVSGEDRNIYKFCIELYPKSELDAMTETFKDISNEDDMKAFFESYSEMLKVGEGYSDNKIKILSELHSENDYSDIEDADVVTKELKELDATMALVQNVIDTLNKYSAKNKWGYIQSTIEDDNKELAEKSSTFADLMKKASTNSKVSKKGIYMRMTDMEFTCLSDIVEAYDEAYEDQKDFEAEENTNTPANRPSGGGGGFGGGGSKVEIAPELIPEPEVEELEAEKAPVAAFNDLEGYDWAKDAINGLRNLSIVRGDGNGNFRPGDEVTREEFLSMLLDTFYVDKTSGSVPFADVKAGQWYSDVVSTAYGLNVTKGMGDGTFGIGENILRADMVVMASRLAASKNITIKKSNVAVVFEDFPAIPDYAYNDVIAFQQAGLVQGDEAGKFNPGNNLTRAEAAVFFWNLFNYIERQI